MFLSDHERIELTARRIERIDRRVNTERGDLTRQHDSGVEMSEGRSRRRIGKIVRRHIHGLDRGDRARLGRGDALLEHAHFFGQRRLVAHRRRHASKQRRHFGTGERVAVDIVDEEQHVTALDAVLTHFVTEIFSHGETRERDAQAITRRLVHLAINHRHFRVFKIFEIDDARLPHLVVEVVAFTSTLTHAGEHG